MEARKISVAATTLMRSDLNKKQKAKLREKRAVELVRSRPYMQPITFQDFGRELGMLPGNASNLITRMEKKGLIVKHKIGLKKNAYTADMPPKTTVNPIEGLKFHITERKPEANDLNLIQRAMQYYWETGDDSLHSFVKWLGQ